MKKNNIVEIEISQLSVPGVIGVYAKERLKPQELIFDIMIHYDGKKAMESDYIDDAVDYYKITKQITEIVKSTEYFLLERLLDEILTQLMQDKRIIYCRLKAYKPEVFASGTTHTKTTVSATCSATIS